MDDNVNILLNSFKQNNLDVRWKKENTNTDTIFDLNSEDVIVLIVEENKVQKVCKNE